MLGDYLTSFCRLSFPFTSVISNMQLIRDSIGSCEWDIFPALRTVRDTERKGGRNKREKGKEEERKLWGVRKRKRRKRWQRKDERKQRDRETEIGLREEYVTEKKKNTQKPINKSWTDLAETSWWERDEAMTVSIASGIFQFVSNVMPPEIFWSSL